MNINHTNLADSPEFTGKTKNLIEKSFGYQPENSFLTDFYPLFNKENFMNCHILESEGEVLAHIGVKQRRLAGYTVNMYGGIVVAKKMRGQGLFRKLFNQTLKNYNSCALHFLWSNELSLYQKFNFHPAVSLYEYDQKKSSHSFHVEEVQWSEFREEELYKNFSEQRLERSDKDWGEIKKISSCRIYLIKDETRTVNYFIKDKGQDLQGIIFEYGDMNIDYLNCMRNYGKVWTPQAHAESLSIYSTVIRLGDENQLTDFLRAHYKIEVLELSETEIEFKFQDLNVRLDHSDFLKGVFGPTPFEEFAEFKPLFISGLDSI